MVSASSLQLLELLEALEEADADRRLNLLGQIEVSGDKLHASNYGNMLAACTCWHSDLM